MKHDRWPLLSWLLLVSEDGLGHDSITFRILPKQEMPCFQSCSSFKLPHINLRTTQKSTSSSNWHMWFENNAQNKCTHKKWKKRWTWDSDGWFSSITAKQKGPQKTPCCGVGRPTAIHFLFNPWDVWKLRGKEKRKALCLKYTLTKILPL